MRQIEKLESKGIQEKRGNEINVRKRYWKKKTE
jgi:hypothetical protein